MLQLRRIYSWCTTLAKKSFLLLSLKENKAKELAQVISNESCRKILDYLADNEDATESDLASKLNIPISTVHYNMKNLVGAKLVEVEEFHYSPKGKEVNHYKLANKYIIIAPKSTYGIKEKLRSILPVTLLALAGTWLVNFYTQTKTAAFGAVMKAAPMVNEIAADSMNVEAVAKSSGAMMETVPTASQAVAERAYDVATVAQTQPNYAIWFLFGCLFVIVVMAVIEWVKGRRKE